MLVKQKLYSTYASESFLFIYDLVFSTTLNFFIKRIQCEYKESSKRLITSKGQTMLKAVNLYLHLLSQSSIYSVSYSPNILRTNYKVFIKKQVSSSSLWLCCLYKKKIVPTFLIKGLFANKITLLACDWFLLFFTAGSIL
jgi:hypothetical protein